MKIVVADMKKQLKKISNWKGPGLDGVQGFWLNYLRAFHCRIAKQLNLILEDGSVPYWVNQGSTILFVKDPLLGNAVKNVGPITCLPLRWKLFSGMLSEKYTTALRRSRYFLRNRKDVVRAQGVLKINSLIKWYYGIASEEKRTWQWLGLIIATKPLIAGLLI